MERQQLKQHEQNEKSNQQIGISDETSSGRKMCTNTHTAVMKKWAITIDTKYDNRNNDLGKGVMILLGYIPYVST